MKFRFDKVATLEILGISLVFVIQTVILGIFGLLWLGLLVDLLLLGFVILVICKVHKYIKNVEADNEKMKAYTKYKDIRYMTKQQYDLYKEKGYIITEDGIPIIKENIEEVVL